MKSYRVLYYPGDHYFVFKDIGDVFVETIQNMGYDCDSSKDAHSSRIHIVFGANNYIFSKIEVPENSIIVNLEQLNISSVWSCEAYFNFLKRYEVWDYSDSNISYLSKLGITNVKKINIGYSPCIEKYQNWQPNKDIDVFFYGSFNERRVNIYNLLKKHKPHYNILFKFNIYGSERDELISRSKIVLNVHFYESKIFEIVRISYLLSNKVCVISENGKGGVDEEEYEKWKDLVVMSDYENIVNTIDKYLNDDELRIQQGNTGYELFKNIGQQIPL